MEKDKLNQQLIKYARQLLAKDPSDTEKGKKFLTIFGNILKAKAQWEKAVDVLTDPIIILNNDWKVIRMNKATTVYFRKEYREILGMDCHELLYDAKARCEDWLGGGESGSTGNTITEVNDLAIPGTFLRVLYRLPLNDFNATVIYLRDITDLKKAELELKASEWKFKSLIECSPNGILLVKDKKILFSNRAAAKIIGYSEEEIKALDFFQLIERQENTGAPLETNVANLRNRDIESLSGNEFRITRKDGIRKWIHLHSLEIALEHDLTLMVNLVDISKIKEAEQQLIQSEKMVTIGQLAAGMAHEINSPVGFIKSNLGSLQQYFKIMRKIFAMLGKVTAYEKFQESPGFNNDFQNLKSLLKEENSDFLLEDINSILNESLEGIETIGKIVKGIRDFSQIDRNELENVNLNELMDQTLLMTKSQIKKICACEINFEENLPKIFCSPQQLSQVFINIIINAIEAIEKRDETETNFAADKGVIRISTGIFKDPNDSSNDKIQLIFADNGCGISPKNQTRIFDPFFTTKDIGQGTGLGMSIVYNIISKLNGKITIQSREGKGTEFFILLPIGN